MENTATQLSAAELVGDAIAPEPFCDDWVRLHGYQIVGKCAAGSEQGA